MFIIKYIYILVWPNWAGARVAQWVRSLDLTAHTSLSPIRRGFAPSFVNYKKGFTRLASASDKVYQLLAQGRWFSPGTPASSTTKTGRHDIAEILLKVALNTNKSIKPNWASNSRYLTTDDDTKTTITPRLFKFIFINTKNYLLAYQEIQFFLLYLIPLERQIIILQLYNLD